MHAERALYKSPMKLKRAPLTHTGAMLRHAYRQRETETEERGERSTSNSAVTLLPLSNYIVPFPVLFGGALVCGVCMPGQSPYGLKSSDKQPL